MYVTPEGTRVTEVLTYELFFDSTTPYTVLNSSRYEENHFIYLVVILFKG